MALLDKSTLPNRYASCQQLGREKSRFYGDRVITIAWFGFNSDPRRTRCCVLG